MVDLHDVVAEQFHPESPGTPHQRLADGPHPDHPQAALRERAPGQFFPGAGFNSLVHPRLAAGKSQQVTHHRIRHGQGEGVGRAPHADAQAPGRRAVDRVDPRAPFRDDLQARRTGLQHAGAVVVIAADGPVELTGVFEQVGFIEPLTHLGGDQFQPVAFQHRAKAFKRQLHVRRGK